MDIKKIEKSFEVNRVPYSSLMVIDKLKELFFCLYGFMCVAYYFAYLCLSWSSAKVPAENQRDVAC